MTPGVLFRSDVYREVVGAMSLARNLVPTHSSLLFVVCGIY